MNYPTTLIVFRYVAEPAIFHPSVAAGLHITEGDASRALEILREVDRETLNLETQVLETGMKFDRYAQEWNSTVYAQEGKGNSFDSVSLPSPGSGLMQAGFGPKVVREPGPARNLANPVHPAISRGGGGARRSGAHAGAAARGFRAQGG